MAESHLPLFDVCVTYSALLEHNCVASSQYCQALSKLAFLAGKQKSSLFAEAKRNCETCLTNCKRTAEAMRAHEATHGCRKKWSAAFCSLARSPLKRKRL